jgi:hypothetical protein
MLIKRIVLVALCWLLNIGKLHGVEIKSLGKIELLQIKDSYLGFPRGFIVTEDGHIVVCDTKAADFKMYDSEGNVIKVFGRKG